MGIFAQQTPLGNVTLRRKTIIGAKLSPNGWKRATKQRQHGPMKSPRVCIGKIGIQFQAALTPVLVAVRCRCPATSLTMKLSVCSPNFPWVFKPSLFIHGSHDGVESPLDVDQPSRL